MNITEVGGREEGIYAVLFIKKQNFTGTQYQTTSVLSSCLSSSSASSFLFQVRHYCVNTCRRREETSPSAPVWNVLSAHKICLRIWELRWLHNSKFQINNLSPANTFLCSYTSICFWKAAGAMGRQKRLVLAGELPAVPPVAWVLLAAGGKVLFSRPPAPPAQIKPFWKQEAPWAKTGISHRIGRSSQQLLILNV